MMKTSVFTGLAILICLIAAGTGISVVADDVQIESCLIVDLVSDNYTFNLTNGPVLKEFNANLLSGFTPDNYTWSFQKDSGPIFGEITTTDNYTTKRITEPGVYNVKVVADNFSGDCYNTDSKDFYATYPINGFVGAMAVPMIAGSGLNCTGYNTTINYIYDAGSANADTFEWNFGDSPTNKTTSVPTVYHQYPILPPTAPNQPLNSYSITVTARNSTSTEIYPTNYSQSMYTPWPPQVINFTMNATTGPVPYTVELNDTSSWPYHYYTGMNPSDPNEEWVFNGTGDGLWDPEGNGTESIAEDWGTPLQYTYTTPGIYNLTYSNQIMVWNCTSCPDPIYIGPLYNRTHKTFIAYDDISANFTNDSVRSCPYFPFTVNFKDDSTGSKIDSWTWDFNDTTPLVTTHTNTTSHTYNAPAIYNVTMKVTNTTYGFSKNVSHLVNVTGLFANFTINPQDPTIWRDDPTTILFNSTSVGTDFSTLYQWTMEKNGRIYTNMSENTCMTYTRNGTYTVSLKLTQQNSACAGINNTSSKQFNITEYLEANFSYNQIMGTYPYEVRFYDQSTDSPTAWNWDFYDLTGGDYNTSTDKNPVYHYYTPGTYRVKFTTTDRNFIVKSKDMEIVVTDNIRSNFSVNKTAGVAPLTAQFTDASYPAGSITNWSWDFNDNTPLNLTPNPLHIFQNPGQYTVNLTVKNASTLAQNSSTMMINVGEHVLANFKPNSTARMNASVGVGFTDLSTGPVTNWLWEFGDGNTSVSPSPVNFFPAFREYQINLTVSNSSYGDSNKTSFLVNVTEWRAPVSDFTGSPQVINVGDFVDFTQMADGPEIESYNWTYGDGSVGTGTTPRHQYLTPGWYTVNLTVKSRYGENTESKSEYIKVRGLNPDFTSVPSGWAVVNSTVIFIDNSQGRGSPAQWQWNFGDGSIQTTSSPTIDHVFTTPGNYTVNMTITNWEQVTKSASHPFIVDARSRPRDVNFEIPLLKYSGSHPLTVQFNQTTPIQSNVTEWYWDFGDRTNYFGNLTDPNAQSPVHTYLLPGEYSVTLTVRNDVGVNEKMRVAYVVVV